MLVPITLSERALYCTLRLVSSSGICATGFIFQTNKGKTVVISNRHFSEETDLDKLDWSKTEIEQDISFDIHLNDGQSINIKSKVKWFLHPSEDLSFFDLMVSLLKYEETIKPKQFLIHRCCDSMIPTQNDLDKLSAIEEVKMIGYPVGLYDECNNFPLIRTGVTASHPAVDYNGKKMGVLDMACLNGSSGSPVFILNEGSYHNKDGGVLGDDRQFLLGIENSNITIKTKNIYTKTVNPETGIEEFKKREDLYVSDDLNLGFYIKSSEIYGFSIFDEYF